MSYDLLVDHARKKLKEYIGLSERQVAEHLAYKGSVTLPVDAPPQMLPPETAPEVLQAQLDTYGAQMAAHSKNKERLESIERILRSAQIAVNGDDRAEAAHASSDDDYSEKLFAKLSDLDFKKGCCEGPMEGGAQSLDVSTDSPKELALVESYEELLAELRGYVTARENISAKDLRDIFVEKYPTRTLEQLNALEKQMSDSYEMLTKWQAFKDYEATQRDQAQSPSEAIVLQTRITWASFLQLEKEDLKKHLSDMLEKDKSSVNVTNLKRAIAQWAIVRLNTVHDKASLSSLDSQSRSFLFGKAFAQLIADLKELDLHVTSTADMQSGRLSKLCSTLGIISAEYLRFLHQDTKALELFKLTSNDFALVSPDGPNAEALAADNTWRLLLNHMLNYVLDNLSKYAEELTPAATIQESVTKGANVAARKAFTSLYSFLSGADAGDASPVAISKRKRALVARILTTHHEAYHNVEQGNRKINWDAFHMVAIRTLKETEASGAQVFDGVRRVAAMASSATNAVGLSQKYSLGEGLQQAYRMFIASIIHNAQQTGCPCGPEYDWPKMFEGYDISEVTDTGSKLKGARV